MSCARDSWQLLGSGVGHDRFIRCAGGGQSRGLNAQGMPPGLLNGRFDGIAPVTGPIGPRRQRMAFAIENFQIDLRLYPPPPRVGLRPDAHGPLPLPPTPPAL